MIVKTLVAAAVLAGSASLALAQSYPFDGTPDNTLSYGPRAPSAVSAASSAQEPVSGGPYYQYDQTPDKTMSYGARTAR